MGSTLLLAIVAAVPALFLGFAAGWWRGPGVGVATSLGALASQPSSGMSRGSRRRCPVTGAPPG
jgi:hypothetical protein